MAKLTETTAERRFTLELSEVEVKYLASVLSHTIVEGKYIVVDRDIFHAVNSAAGTLVDINIHGPIEIEDDE